MTFQIPEAGFSERGKTNQDWCRNWIKCFSFPLAVLCGFCLALNADILLLGASPNLNQRHFGISSAIPFFEQYGFCGTTLPKCVSLLVAPA